MIKKLVYIYNGFYDEKKVFWTRVEQECSADN